MQKTLFSLALLAMCSGAAAQTAGSWLVQGGLTRITPSGQSGALSAPAPSGTTATMGADSQPTLQVTYVYNNNLSVAVPLGLGFTHKLHGSGAVAGVGQIGTVSALPLTVFGQYRFGEANAKVRPYAMLGLNYVRFSDAKGSATLDSLNPSNPAGGHTSLKVDSKFAISPGLGVSVQLNDRWFVDASYAKTFLKTTTHLSTGQTMAATLNPSIVSVGLGMRY